MYLKELLLKLRYMYEYTCNFQENIRKNLVFTFKNEEHYNLLFNSEKTAEKMNSDLNKLMIIYSFEIKLDNISEYKNAAKKRIENDNYINFKDYLLPLMKIQEGIYSKYEKHEKNSHSEQRRIKFHRILKITTENIIKLEKIDEFYENALNFFSSTIRKKSQIINTKNNIVLMYEYDINSVYTNDYDKEIEFLSEYQNIDYEKTTFKIKLSQDNIFFMINEYYGEINDKQKENTDKLILNLNKITEEIKRASHTTNVSNCFITDYEDFTRYFLEAAKKRKTFLFDKENKKKMKEVLRNYKNEHNLELKSNNFFDVKQKNGNYIDLIVEKIEKYLYLWKKDDKSVKIEDTGKIYVSDENKKKRLEVYERLNSEQKKEYNEFYDFSKISVGQFLARIQWGSVQYNLKDYREILTKENKKLFFTPLIKLQFLKYAESIGYDVDMYVTSEEKEFLNMISKRKFDKKRVLNFVKYLSHRIDVYRKDDEATEEIFTLKNMIDDKIEDVKEASHIFLKEY